ncbi:MAG: hypothetical protein HY644_12100 [Acidobacteria bacterium]|nr:hypothetical protein [Acidobacteriota bacterium]
MGWMKAMHDWTGKDISLQELARLYQSLAGEWLLLEVVDDGEEKRPAKFRLHAHHVEKDRLRDYMLENDDWGWHRKYLFVLADPGKPCDIDLGSQRKL